MAESCVGSFCICYFLPLPLTYINYINVLSQPFNKLNKII